jgi:hypothetical protein
MELLTLKLAVLITVAAERDGLPRNARCSESNVAQALRLGRRSQTISDPDICWTESVVAPDIRARSVRHAVLDESNSRSAQTYLVGRSVTRSVFAMTL